MSIGMKAPSEAAELTGDRDMQWTSYRHQAIKSGGDRAHQTPFCAQGCR